MPDTEKIRIVCISDTHNKAPGEGYTLPSGDILIHAGDLTNQGSLSEIQKAVSWLSKADFKTKIVIAGNHDLSLDPDYRLKHAEGWKVQPEPTDAAECRRLLAENDSFIYLQHTSHVITIPEKNLSLKVFGSPYSPDRGRQNWAFQYEAETEAARLWSGIPDDTDIIVSHTPAKGICDASRHWTEGGCPGLLREGLWRVRPLLHVCGHCHEGRGAKVVRWGGEKGEVEGVREWEDPGRGSKKQSLLDLTEGRRGMGLDAGRETAVVNASVKAKSFGRGGMEFNKPIVVDLTVPCQER
ncbi:hypothetical protein KC340_g17184 [Hortaea werneckii]|nr:hypothetical protein KC342_g3396 [Hortaea werneckii]KAI7062955.1 hypothetical protein KC339_g16418 [Hortaea werneckii]KAI7207844.1 hypothetical protein KC365_g16360 [Hortaea werneckii]KAI7291132.1 hypothetical protein KC340_g17184 [Hortaea werneckii]KAI7375703.1 hypothetical protein KC328_g15276 [Hortaea werneckii]